MRRARRFTRMAVVTSVLSMMGLLCAVEAAAPRRIAFPPSVHTTLLPADDRLAICLSLFLQDAFRDHPDFRLVSEKRAGAILVQVRGGARDFAERDLLRLFSEFVPIDAFIDFQVVDNDKTIRLAIHSKKGVAVRTLPYPGRGGWIAEAADQLVPFIIEELGLAPASAARLTDCLKRHRGIFDPYYISQRLGGHYTSNGGEARMGQIQSVISFETATDPLLAARVIDAAYVTLTDSRKTTGISPQKALGMGIGSLPVVLGTPQEDAARPLVVLRPGSFENQLLQFAGPLAKDEVNRLLDEAQTDGPNADGMGVLRPASPLGNVSAADRDAPPMEARRRAALRILGWIRSAKALDLMGKCTAAEEAPTRRAVATALGNYTNAAAVHLLETLAGDKDDAVAFTASLSLHACRQPSPRRLELARKSLDNPDFRLEALQALATAGDSGDEPRFRRYLADPSVPVRCLAISGLLRYASVTPEEAAQLLDDTDQEVVIAAVAALPATAMAAHSPSGALFDRLAKLANEPFDAVSGATRTSLSRWRPRDTTALDRFEVDVEHSYIRMRIVEGWATNPAPWTLEALVKACANVDPHTRSCALTRLAARDAVHARPLLLAALADPHRWVRFHAVVELASLATAAETEAIRAALRREPDRCMRLYLADALAKAEGNPLPPPQPAAHPVHTTNALTWLCGIPGTVTSADTPYEAYYTCASPVFSEEIQRSHQTGKVIYPRPTPIGNPGMIVTDPESCDSFWVALGREFPSNVLSVTDGVVYGEESMSVHPQAIWPSGWRLFCRDAGIDPDAVNGDMSHLTPSQKLAWDDWGYNVAIDGFNILYEYTKRYLGKLRPGIMVATFLPRECGVTPAAHRWKFDVGGHYSYSGDNRGMYASCRIYKTIWPERPVIWLSNGAAETQQNPTPPVLGVNYPNKPIAARWDRPYADNLAIWLAGADPGWFSSWAGTHRKFPGSAAWLGLEAIYPGSPAIEAAIAFAFQTADFDYRFNTNTAPVLGAALEDDGPQVAVELEEVKPTDDPVFKLILADKDRYRMGHHYFANYDHDTARVLRGLPRRFDHHPALVIGSYSTPGAMLLNGFDCLPNLVLPVNLRGLGQYRFIAVNDCEKVRLTDDAIAAYTAWLRDTPGLLYIHGTISTNNALGTPTAADTEGHLARDWPWEGEIEHRGEKEGGYGVSGARANVLGKNKKGDPDCVLWRDPAFKGAAMFDLGGLSLAESRRKEINRLFAERGIGLKLDGPFGQLTGSTDGLQAAVSYNSGVTNRLTGFDLLTGVAGPAAGPERDSALAAESYVAEYVAVLNGVSVLCEKPITKIESIPGGLRIESPGWIRANVATGSPRVRRAGGGDLPKISEEPCKWVVLGSKPREGMAVITLNGGDAPPSTFVRASSGVEITVK